MDSGLIGLIGLARRAGKAELGEEKAVSAALDHKARLILVSADAAENTVKKVRRCAGEGNAPFVPIGLTKAELGRAVGMAGCAVVAVTDVGLAAAAMKKLSQTDPQRYGETAQALERKAEKNLRRKREKRQRQKRAASPKPWAAPPREKKS